MSFIVRYIFCGVIYRVFTGIFIIRAEQSTSSIIKQAEYRTFLIEHSNEIAVAVGQTRNFGEFHNFTVTVFENIICAVIFEICYFFALLLAMVMKEEMSLSDCHSFDAYASLATV